MLKDLPVILLEDVLEEVREKSTETSILHLLKFNKPILRLLCSVTDDIKWITDHLAEN